MEKMVAGFGFCDMNYEYVMQKLINKQEDFLDEKTHQYTLEQYLEVKSNYVIPYGIEKGIDEAWLWACKENVLKDDFDHLTTDEFRYLLTEIFIRMVQKGAKLEDYSDSNFDMTKVNNNDLSYIDDLVDFIIKNPQYGEDGNGFWFV